MKKQTVLRRIVLCLAVVLVLALTLSGCGKEANPYTSDHTVNTLSTSIRTLSDSEFTDSALLKAIYTNAFSHHKTAISVMPKDLAETLPTLFGGEVDEMLITATVAYGGTAANDVTIGELEPTSTVEQSQLYVGDLLFVNNTADAYYIYDKDGFVNLSAPLEDVDTAAVLASLPDSNRFAVIRPMLNMTDHDFVTEDAPEQDLTEAQKAIIATAQSFLLRGDKLQYVSLADGLSSDRFLGVSSPEDHTDDNYGPLQCSGFCYDVYYQALGMELEYEGHKLNSSGQMRKYSPELGIQKYLMNCKKAAEYTEEDKERISKEILDLLEPGDVLVVDRAEGGHVMLYVGNGDIIHASGSVYNEVNQTETYEATVRQMRFADYFFKEDTYGYLFGSDTGKRVSEFFIMRPLDIFEGEIPEVTKNRMANLSGVMAQKLSSHNISLTANVGEEITYTFELYNQNDEEITLAVSDVVPEKAEYVSGADTVNGDNLSWQVTIPANTRKTVSYVVKVAADAQKGDEIGGKSGLVGGVPVNCPTVTVGNDLSATEIETLKAVIDGYAPREGISGFEMVNDIYTQAFGWKPVFADTDFDTVYEGENGIFVQETEWVKNKLKFWVRLRDDTTYGQMAAPRLTGGYGTKEGRLGKPIVMPAKEQQFVVGDILICKSFDEQSLYLYAGDGVLYDLMNGYAVDERTVRGRMEYFLCTDQGYTVLRPSLLH